MRRLTYHQLCGLGLGVLFTVALAGCDCSGQIDGDVDASPGMDGGEDAASSFPDGGQRDGGPPSCRTDLDCPPGLLCFNRLCQPDPCATFNPCDAEGERCRAMCVDLVDPCAGVTCGANETCINGVCFPGCLPVACEGKICSDGEFCDPSSGQCVEILGCEAQCGSSRACHLTCTPRSTCEGVTCEEGEFCRAGECIPNPCFGVTCSPGEVCQNGTCVATCECDPPCVPPNRCVANRCVCAPSCAPDAACGTPDGCGGFCVGRCLGANEECNPDTGLCECIPQCPEEAACGDDDGCGGRCDGPCSDGRACVGGICTCTDSCLPSGMVDCGMEIPDTCMGSLECTGSGTRCPSGATCNGGRCCPNCPSAGSVACGMPIPDRVDPSGASCRTCSGVGSQCPGSASCVDPPGGGGPSARVCCGSCPSASSVPCGMDIPDVLDANGVVCRTCSGVGTGGCGSGTSCVGGAGGMCCSNCPGASTVDCGEPIPSPSCRTCSGFGSRCPSGTSCRNPPGTSGADARVCCGDCPSAGSVACGMPIAPVLDSDGAVCRTCGTGTMCASGSECRGGSCCPLCPSESSVACGVDIPDQRDSTGAVCRTCGAGTMCEAGRTCTGGSCCTMCAPASSLDCGVDPMEASGCPSCPNGTRCPAGSVCRSGSCCTPSCTAPSTRACGSTPSDGCGGTCSPGTLCMNEGETCSGNPLRCTCTPSCEGRRCGESDGCGGECIGACDPGFVCAERPPPAAPGDYQCEPSACIPSCGLCQSCILGTCEPLTCAPGENPCLFTCECCAPSQICSVNGCIDFG